MATSAADSVVVACLFKVHQFGLGEVRDRVLEIPGYKPDAR